MTTKEKVERIKAMLPHVDKDLIQDILLQMKGDEMKAMDMLLSLSIDEPPVEPKAPSAQKSKASDTESGAKAYLRSSGKLKSSKGVDKKLQDSQNSLKNSGEYPEDDDDGEQLIFEDEDDELFTFDEKNPHLVHNPDKNPNDIDKDIAFLPPPHELTALNVLNTMQTKALTHVVSSSKLESEKLYPQVLQRIERMKFTEKQLKRTLHYIRDEAPIIVHINCDKVLEMLYKDTHYRSQFETNTSGGYLNQGTRIEWENRLFNKIYDAKCPPFDRVKYGVLNIVNDPSGVKCCASYGDSYLLMKNVRLRTTFADKDTSNADVKLSCCEYYTHVLASYNDAELQAVIQVANGIKPWADSNIIQVYKEVQIHGPILLNKDIDALVMNKRHKGNKQMENTAKLFAEKNKCNLVWME